MNYLKPTRKPNFFILGAAKSGTTTLHSCLSQHPEIFMSEVKEPSFFCDKFQVIDNELDYFSLFDGVENEKIIGESSHVYLTNPGTARVLHSLFPNAKFILLLRDPVDRAQSLFHHMRRHGHETINSFEKALAVEEKRIQSPSFKKDQYLYNYLYVESGKYGRQIDRYLSFFPTEQFLFLTSSEFFQNPEQTLQKVYKFLEVANIVYQPIQKLNEGGNVKSPHLARILKNPLFSQGFFKKTGLSKVLHYLNKGQKNQLKEGTRDMIQSQLKEDQELLFELTGIRFF